MPSPLRHIYFEEDEARKWYERAKELLAEGRLNWGKSIVLKHLDDGRWFIGNIQQLRWHRQNPVEYRIEENEIERQLRNAGIIYNDL